MPAKKEGYIHIYCGDGKGKTTTGMGLCTRAAGYGYKVLIYQFMKSNKTSERKVLEKNYLIPLKQLPFKLVKLFIGFEKV